MKQYYDTIIHIRLALDLLAELLQNEELFHSEEDRRETCLFIAEAARAKAAELEAAAE